MSPVLIISIIAIGFVLAIIGLIVALKKSSKKTPSKQISKKTEVKKDEKKFDLDDLMDIVKNPNTPSSGVLDALIYFNEDFSIDEKNSKKCFLFLSRALTHPNKNKNIFQYFHKEIKPKNKQFKSELETIESKALS
jgi:hypothetical protein